MKQLLACSALSLCVWLSACATPTSAGPTIRPWSSLEETAILAVIDQALLAIGNRDADAMKPLLAGEFTAFYQRRTDAAGDGPVQRAPAASLVTAGDPFIERYWEPVVLVRGSIAMVWVPYELRDNGQVVHCGIDGFDMVKLSGQWRIASLLSTMEPDACDEIRPPTVAAMRPRDGWRETPLQ